jgi:hypothetical protein
LSAVASSLDPGGGGKRLLDVTFIPGGKEELGPHVLLRRDEFIVASKKILTYINRAVEDRDRRLTGPFVTSILQGVKLGWKRYETASRAAQPIAVYDRALRLARQRRIDRQEYYKIEFAGRELENWAYNGDISLPHEIVPQYEIPEQCFFGREKVDEQANVTSTSVGSSWAVQGGPKSKSTPPTPRSSTPERIGSSSGQPNENLESQQQELRTGQPSEVLEVQNSNLMAELNREKDHQQFLLDKVAIAGLEDGINEMVVDVTERSVLKGYRNVQQIADAYKAKMKKLLKSHAQIGELGKQLKDNRIMIVIDQ